MVDADRAGISGQPVLDACRLARFSVSVAAPGIPPRPDNVETVREPFVSMMMRGSDKARVGTSAVAPGFGVLPRRVLQRPYIGHDSRPKVGDRIAQPLF